MLHGVVQVAHVCLAAGTTSIDSIGLLSSVVRPSALKSKAAWSFQRILAIKQPHHWFLLQICIS